MVSYKRSSLLCFIACDAVTICLIDATSCELLSAVVCRRVRRSSQGVCSSDDDENVFVVVVVADVF
jgi:hypothetical protein